MIALTMLAAAVALPGYQQAVVDCVSQHAVALAKGTDAPASELVAAADAECFGTWQQAHMIGQWSYASVPADSPAFRALVDGEAIRAVLAARGR